MQRERAHRLRNGLEERHVDDMAGERTQAVLLEVLHDLLSMLVHHTVGYGEQGLHGLGVAQVTLDGVYGFGLGLETQRPPSAGSCLPGELERLLDKTPRWGCGSGHGLFLP